MNWLNRIVNTDKITAKRLFIIALVLIAGLEVITVNILHLGHGHFWFENLPAFGSGYGFISCLLIIILAKFILAPLLGKKEDYYD
ncbi:MAG: hypothetical protein N3A62_00170 [Thermodesulfovibrionales bacterium]|nr:hypothetical protein [Thermodesulfovibrionales bacterium]